MEERLETRVYRSRPAACRVIDHQAVDRRGILSALFHTRAPTRVFPSSSTAAGVRCDFQDVVLSGFIVGIMREEGAMEGLREDGRARVRH